LPLIDGDRIQLQQGILNLILNPAEAIRDIEEGLREMRIGTGREASNGVLVSVRHSGPGWCPPSDDPNLGMRGDKRSCNCSDPSPYQYGWRVTL
jgi:hypothetical protein